MHTVKCKCILSGLVAGLALAVHGQGSGLDGAISIKSQEAVVDVPVREVVQKVKWMKNPIKVDGDKADWIANGVAPVRLAGSGYATWFKGTYGGEADFAANIWLGRDYDNLYIGIEAEDDRLPATDRMEIAFSDAETKVIVGWQDVGRRYLADDGHAIFVVSPKDEVGIHWAHLQTRIDHSVVQDSYGSETERRALLEHGAAKSAANYKIFTKVSRNVREDGKSTTFVEIALPWRTLLPFDPVKGAPIKFNVAVHDRDGEGAEQANGALAWQPGIVGVFSAAHFPVLEFEAPAGRTGVDVFAQVPSYRYLNRKIPASVSFQNNGAATTGKLQLLAAPGTGAPLAEIDVEVPAGAGSATIAVESEAVGQPKTSLMGRLILASGEKMDFPVFAPRSDNTISIQRLADVQSRIDQLRQDCSALTNLYNRVVAAGCDTAYPKAYLTLLSMFVARCNSDMNYGDADRVLRNTDHLKTVYAEAVACMEAALANPSTQIKPPPKFKPGELKIRDGYYFDGDRPVFLWGPCVFWYWKEDQPQVVDLGFNSVCPEVPFRLTPTNEVVVAHMEYWRKNGVHVNAAMNVPDLQLTGSDVKASQLLKEHPELKNLDPNNFLPFVIQHPIAREKIRQGFKESIEFWNNFPWIGSYWLWNEPWYVNYSEPTRLDFIEAMKKKYGNVEALNKRWKSSYKKFEDIQLITWPDPVNTAPWYDFQVFRDDLLVDFFGFLNKVSKEYARNKPTHTKFMAPSMHSFNIERLQGLYDIAGHDGNSGDAHLLFLDFCRSLYPEKPLSNTEVHIWYGGKTFVEKVAWRLALHGLADGNWWCWHGDARFSDSLGNAESMHALAISGLDVQRLFYPHIYELVKKEKPIATLFPDVIERRSDISMLRLRFELGMAQYMLGLQPFYATETRIAEGELDKHKFLLAGESAFVKDATYEKVLEFVKKGGTAIVTKGGFALNEYGDPRDASELVKPEGGEPYGDFARIYPVGEGNVICIDSAELRIEPVADGSISMRGSSGPDNGTRRQAYYSTLSKLMADNGIDQELRLVPSGDAAANPDAMVGYDWRVAKVDGAYTMAVLAGESKEVKLQSARPVRKIVNLISGAEIPVGQFKVGDGPNLFRIELD